MHPFPTDLKIDGILVFWNSPEDQPQHADLAVECAIAMHAKLRELNMKWGKEGIPEIVCRIGINTGDVLSGNIGSPEKMKFGMCRGHFSCLTLT